MNNHMMEAKEALGALNFEKALTLYRQELSVRPDNALAHEGVARCVYKLGKPTEAIPELQRALELDHRFVMAHVLLAQMYDEIKESARSREHIKLAYEISPIQKDVLAVYGTFLLFDNKLDEAMAMLEKAVEVDPDSYTAYRNLVVIYFRMRDRKKMLFCAKEMRRLDPSFKSFIRLAVAYMNYTRLINVLFVSFFILAITFQLLHMWVPFLFSLSFFALLIFVILYIRN